MNAQPNVPQPQRFQFKLRSLLLIIVPLAVAMAFVHQVYQGWRAIPDCYAAWDTGMLVVSYLKNNDGKWPTSWKDLLEANLPTRGEYGEGTEYGKLSDKIRVNWEFDPNSIEYETWDPDFRVVTRADGTDFLVLVEDPNRMIWESLSKHRPRGGPR